jgi:hypothetical protein
LAPVHVKKALRVMSLTVVLFSLVVVFPILVLIGLLMSALGVEWLFL